MWNTVNAISIAKAPNCLLTPIWELLLKLYYIHPHPLPSAAIPLETDTNSRLSTTIFHNYLICSNPLRIRRTSRAINRRQPTNPVAFHAKYKFALDEVSDNKETKKLWRLSKSPHWGSVCRRVRQSDSTRQAIIPF